MENRNILVLFVAIAAVVFSMASVSAFADIQSVTVSGIDYSNPDNVPSTGVFAGETLPIRVNFLGDGNQDEVRIVARLIGGTGFEATDRFDVLDGQIYTRLINFELPSDLDDDREQDFFIEITIESDSAGEGDSVLIPLQVQRESFQLEILAIEASDNNRVQAGKTLGLNVVVKNRGRQEARDTFVRATIPELGISKTVFFGDLSAQDEGNPGPDKFDTEERRLFLNIPNEATPGIYNVEIETFNDDSITKATKKIVVVGATEGSGVFASSQTKSFAVNELETFSLTLVNSGDTIQVYQLATETSGDVSAKLDSSIVAVPAGTSKTVMIEVSSSEEGTHAFAVNVQTMDGDLIKRETFTANVEGRSSVGTGSAAVVLTIVLAVIFVVLLVVLIVLLTRKPGKNEEFGESYY